MRLRVERRIRKLLRQGGQRAFVRRALAKLVAREERAGLTLTEALLRVTADRPAGHFVRGEAAKLLRMGGEPRMPLLQQFFAQEEERELWETGLALEESGDLRAVRPLVGALYDANVHRRHAAARALGWIGRKGNRSAPHLARVLTDTTQPGLVREEAAESLAYRYRPAVLPALLAALADPDPRIRFWTVFALGSARTREHRTHDPRAVAALESMLSDEGMMPTFWPVRLEALAMLQSEPGYGDRVKREVERIQTDPHALDYEVAWAGFYGGR